MPQRYMSIWFRYLITDWFTLRRPELSRHAFVLAAAQHGRMVITAVNPLAQMQGIEAGMAVADARAIFPNLQVLDDKPDLAMKLLKAIGDWCIRYTPVAAVDPEDGLILDITGCAHLWGGEEAYRKEIITKLKSRGYHVQAAIADTIGAAWAVARFGQTSSIIAFNDQLNALMPLPPAALRLELTIVERLHKLGLNRISHLINMQRSAMRRRFGQELLLRLNQALGTEMEFIQPLQPIEPYQERLPCVEPIRTLRGIEIALEQLLNTLCLRLQQEGKGLRKAVFKGLRTDGNMQQIEIGTNRPSHNKIHLFKLFELKLPLIEPDLGIELFILEAPTVEPAPSLQEGFWNATGSLDDVQVAELIDRLTGKAGAANVHRYLPAEHHWPERSVKPALSLTEKPATPWALNRPRPVLLLPQPQKIEVTAPIPDYPPMLFRYKGKLHTIKKADGPERMEREWWLEEGRHRDYYIVEDEQGQRYWLFRSGHYDEAKPPDWYIHGFFA